MGMYVISACMYVVVGVVNSLPLSPSLPPDPPIPPYLSTRKGCAVRSCTLISLAASAAPSSLAAALRIAISSLAWRNFFSTLFLLGPYE